MFTGESALHQSLRRAACAWLWDRGLTAIAEEVVVPGVGIIDVAAAGRWVRWNPRRPAFEYEPRIDRHHVLFIECKAMRADFLRDQGCQGQFGFALAERRESNRGARRKRPRRTSPALGKFDTCLIRPRANLHYLLTPPGLIKSHETPRRWGWMVYDGAQIRVLRKPKWQELSDVSGIEGAIARALTRRFLGARGSRSVRGESVPPAGIPSEHSRLSLAE